MNSRSYEISEGLYDMINMLYLRIERKPKETNKQNKNKIQNKNKKQKQKTKTNKNKKQNETKQFKTNFVKI